MGLPHTPAHALGLVCFLCHAVTLFSMACPATCVCCTFNSPQFSVMFTLWRFPLCSQCAQMSFQLNCWPCAWHLCALGCISSQEIRACRCLPFLHGSSMAHARRSLQRAEKEYVGLVNNTELWRNSRRPEAWNHSKQWRHGLSFAREMVSLCSSAVVHGRCSACV